jgi:hypothetical protein
MALSLPVSVSLAGCRLVAGVLADVSLAFSVSLTLAIRRRFSGDALSFRWRFGGVSLSRALASRCRERWRPAVESAGVPLSKALAFRYRERWRLTGDSAGVFLSIVLACY